MFNNTSHCWGTRKQIRKWWFWQRHWEIKRDNYCSSFLAKIFKQTMITTVKICPNTQGFAYIWNKLIFQKVSTSIQNVEHLTEAQGLTYQRKARWWQKHDFNHNKSALPKSREAHCAFCPCVRLHSEVLRRIFPWSSFYQCEACCTNTTATPGGFTENDGTTQ